MSKLFPVILCGGSGVRLWPISRSTYPKQFMDISGRSLFDDTLMRAVNLPASVEQAEQAERAGQAGQAGQAEPIILCNEEQRFLAAAALQARGISASIVLEPVARNTAPAIALAAFAAHEQEEDALMLVLPSDHKVEPQAEFAKAVQAAFACAKQGYLVTFGVVPLGPETGYGYICQGEALKDNLPGQKVSRFVEKPDQASAKAMLAEGGYFWNSGMFLFKASTYLQELKKYTPEIYAQCQKAWQGRTKDFDFIRVDKQAFENSPANSIDYAVMEHTEFAAVVPLSAQWSDLGSWQAFYEAAQKDEAGNSRIGDVLIEDVQDCYIHSSSRLVAALGVRDLVLVETADAVLVADRKCSQDVKKIVEKLSLGGRVEKDEHVLTLRPWGSYQILAQGNAFKVKRIIVNPEASLSLQLHHHRAEHWVVVSGTAKVTVGKESMLLSEDQSNYISIGTLHRLENPGMIPLEIIEIQTGSYLGEDDIVRLEDKFGRKDKQ